MPKLEPISRGLLQEKFLNELMKFGQTNPPRIELEWIKMTDVHGHWLIDWSGCSAAEFPSDAHQKEIRDVERLLQEKYLVTRH